MDTKQAGVLAILAASIMWAIEPILAKLSYQNSDFLQTSAIRAIIVMLTAAAYVIITNKSNFRIDRRQFSTLAYIAIAGTLFADLMYFFSLTKVPVINAVIIGHMQPIFIVLFGFFVLKEDKLARFDYAGIMLMILSGLLATTKTPENFAMLKLGTFGDLMVLSATVAWATTTIAMRKYIRDINAGVATFYRFLFASIAFVIYFALTSPIKISSVYQILIGLVVGIGTILYYEGLKRIKAAQVSALELSAPFFAAMLGFFILGETVTKLQMLGLVLLFAGIHYLSKRDEPR